MRLVPDDVVAGWLATLEGRPGDFDWDEGNQTKSLLKHGVRTEEVESLLVQDFLFAGRIVEPEHDEPRWLLLGRSGRGRLLALVFTRRGARLRPISCRAMRAGERRLYAEQVEGEQEGG